MSLVSRYLDPAVLQRLAALQLSARSVVEGMTSGRHRSPLRGASVEFRQHRAYVAGDEPRRLDWRVLARTDRPYVREYDEETNLRCAILLDRSGSMGYRGRGDATAERRRGGGTSKFEYAAKVVASLSHLMLTQSESVGLATFAGGRLDRWLPPHGHDEQLARVIDVLERTAPAGASDAPSAMLELAGRLGRRAMVIVVSDLFAPAVDVRKALARLRHARHEVVTLRVLHDDEVEFPFTQPVRLRGLEGEPPRLCEPALVRQRYLDHFRAHAQQLQDAHRAHRAEFHSLRTGRDLGEALIGFLRHRASVGAGSRAAGGDPASP
jgi:uncharacterized protein (DUF58 family)